LKGSKWAYGLGERSALADGDLVTILDTESGGDVCGEVLVAALVTGVLGDEVEVLAADDERAVHLGRDDSAGEDTAADGDETGEGALLVCAHDTMSVCAPCVLRFLRPHVHSIVFSNAKTFNRLHAASPPRSPAPAQGYSPM